ncbi:hypothetical protein RCGINGERSNAP_84 [Rhodobacter phage RcGingersnap]|nr:hypothetical protein RCGINGERSNAP_84 [Rhodobacter phage RcGingersnap]UUV43454.1 hypothetical protein RCEXPLORER_85 [Rhodobacter phage RcExplorer]
MKPAPYTFPHRSRAAMTDYLLNRRSRAYDYRSFRFCWDVKIWAADFTGKGLRKHFPDLDPALDSEWDSHFQGDGESLFWTFCEDAGRQVSDGEWCSYPGDDQGDWEFGFAGRSGGWIVLEKWRGRDMRNPSDDDLAEMSFADLRAFYRGIRTADSDFTTAKASAEVEYQAASYREGWEAERKAERACELDAFVIEMELARPDLAPAYL